MKINLNYNSKAEETPQEMTYNLISYAVNTKYKDGLQGQLLRMWGRIQRKFDDAIKNKGEEVELDESEKDFIFKTWNDESVKFPPIWSKYILTIEDEFDRLKKEK